LERWSRLLPVPEWGGARDRGRHPPPLRGPRRRGRGALRFGYLRRIGERVRARARSHGWLAPSSSSGPRTPG